MAAMLNCTRILCLVWRSTARTSRPLYVYPGILWAKIFGATVPSLRAYSVFVLMIGFLGCVLFIQGSFLGKVPVVFSWCWPATCSLCVVLGGDTGGLGIVFCAGVCDLGRILFWRSTRWWWIGRPRPCLLAAAMYSLPAGRRMQIPLMMVTLGCLWNGGAGLSIGSHC